MAKEKLTRLIIVMSDGHEPLDVTMTLKQLNELVDHLMSFRQNPSDHHFLRVDDAGTGRTHMVAPNLITRVSTVGKGTPEPEVGFKLLGG